MLEMLLVFSTITCEGTSGYKKFSMDMQLLYCYGVFKHRCRYAWPPDLAIGMIRVVCKMRGPWATSPEAHLAAIPSAPTLVVPPADGSTSQQGVGTRVPKHAPSSRGQNHSQEKKTSPPKAKAKFAGTFRRVGRPTRDCGNDHRRKT